MNQRQLELRLLDSIRKEDCACCEMTCNHCIAVFIENGDLEQGDRALSILEGLDQEETAWTSDKRCNC